MFCAKCGASVSNTDTFCSRCGAAINNTGSSNVKNKSSLKKTLTKEIISRETDNKINDYYFAAGAVCCTLLFLFVVVICKAGYVSVKKIFIVLGLFMGIFSISESIKLSKNGKRDTTLYFINIIFGTFNTCFCAIGLLSII